MMYQLNLTTSKDPFGNATGNLQGRFRFELEFHELDATGAKTGAIIATRTIEGDFNEAFDASTKSQLLAEFGLNINGVYHNWNPIDKNPTNSLALAHQVEIKPKYSHDGTTWSDYGNTIVLGRDDSELPLPQCLWVLSQG